MRCALAIVAFAASVGAASACSKSDAPSPSSGGGCTCDITQNGEQQNLPCGAPPTCIGGTTFTCSGAGHVEPGADCGDAGQSPGSSGTSSGALDLECTLGARGADSLKTTYTCPTQDAFAQCRNGNATSCKPKDKKAGTVPLGGPCKKAFIASDPAAEFELADDCAPVTKYGGDGAAKGAFCAFGYCTHLCAPSTVCLDVGPSAQCGGDGVCEK